MENENIWVIVIIVVLILFLFSGFGGMMGGGYGMMGNWGYGFGGMWFFGALFMALILVALVLFILWLVKQIQNNEKKK